MVLDDGALAEVLAVVVPDLDPPPPPYSPSALVIVLSVLAIAATVGFVWVALGARSLSDRGLPILPVAGVALILFLGAVVAAAFVATREQAAHEEAQEASWRREEAAGLQVAEDLEAWFGIEILEPGRVIPSDARNRVEIDRGDGPEDCFVGAPDDVFEIRCGGDTWETATPIEPAGSGR